jgi:hypothetical protein
VTEWRREEYAGRVGVSRRGAGSANGVTLVTYAEFCEAQGPSLGQARERECRRRRSGGRTSEGCYTWSHSGSVVCHGSASAHVQQRVAFHQSILPRLCHRHHPRPRRQKLQQLGRPLARRVLDPHQCCLCGPILFVLQLIRVKVAL